MKNFFKKYVALVTTIALVIISIGMTSVMPNFLGLEGFIMFFVGAMSFVGLVGMFSGGFRNVTKISRVTYVVSILICVGFFFHLKQIDSEVREITPEYTLEETNKFYLLDIEGYKLLTLEKDEIFFTVDKPIKFYEFYKTDLFGYEMLPDLQVKSDLMNDYSKPKMFKDGNH